MTVFNNRDELEEFVKGKVAVEENEIFVVMLLP